MKKFIKKLLREGISEGELRGVNFLKKLLNNVSNPLGKKLLKAWILRGSNKPKVMLSPRELRLLELIKKGGPTQDQFNSKN